MDMHEVVTKYWQEVAPLVPGFQPSRLLNFQAVLLFALIYLLAYVIYMRHIHPLSRVPGPFFASITNLWWVYTARRRRQHLSSVEVHLKYGPLVRIAPNEVLVADPDTFKIIYGAGNKYPKSDFYKPLQKMKWDLTAERNENVHAAERRLVGKAYSMDSVRQIEDFVDDSINHFLRRLAGLTGKELNLGEWFQLYAIDTMTEVTFSNRFGYIDRGEDDGTLVGSKVFLGCAAWIGYVPWVATIHDLLSPIFGEWLGINLRSGKFRSIAAEKIKEHQESEHANHNDILSYLKSVHAKKPDQFTESDMTSMVTSNVFAGSDTTAAALRAMFWFLLTTPGYEDKFRSELEQRRRDGLLSDPVKFNEAESWPFLQACMYEAMRVHSPYAQHLPRVVPDGGLVANGTYLPAGTTVGSNSWAIHRLKTVYGEDVEQFRPERWLDEDRRGDMHRFFFGFGGGSRTCIGRNIVWLEMSKLLPTLLMRFDVKVLDPDKPLPVKNVMLAIQDGPRVILTKKE